MKDWLLQKLIPWLLGLTQKEFSTIARFVSEAEKDSKEAGHAKRTRVLGWAQRMLAFLFKPDGTPSYALNAAIEIAVAILRKGGK
jgi:hypothetical protein